MAKQNNMRMDLFPEHYNRRLNEHQQPQMCGDKKKQEYFQIGILYKSSDHCIDSIDSIRKSTMCHADMAVGSAVWIADSDKEQSKNLCSNAEVSCTNWDTLKFEANERVLETKNFTFASRTFRKKESQTSDVCCKTSGATRTLEVIASGFIKRT